MSIIKRAEIKEKDETVLELVKKLLNDIKSLLEEKKDVIIK